MPVPDPDEQRDRRTERDALLSGSDEAIAPSAVKVRKAGVSPWAPEANEP